MLCDSQPPCLVPFFSSTIIVQEREGVEEQIRAGDEEAEALNVAPDRSDPAYDPSNPRGRRWSASPRFKGE